MGTKTTLPKRNEISAPSWQDKNSPPNEADRTRKSNSPPRGRMTAKPEVIPADPIRVLLRVCRFGTYADPRMLCIRANEEAPQPRAVRDGLDTWLATSSPEPQTPLVLLHS